VIHRSAVFRLVLVVVLLACSPSAGTARSVDGPLGDYTVTTWKENEGLGDQRFQLNVDLYNALNGSTATFIRNTYSAPGAATTTPWLQPTQVQDGRFWKFSLQYDF